MNQSYSFLRFVLVIGLIFFTLNLYSQVGIIEESMYLEESTYIDNGGPINFKSTKRIPQDDLSLNRIYHIGKLEFGNPQNYVSTNGTSSTLQAGNVNFFFLVTDTTGSTVFSTVFSCGQGNLGEINLISKNGDVYLYGDTDGAGLQTTNGTAHQGVQSSFVVKFNSSTITSNGVNFDFASYISGNGEDEITAATTSNNGLWISLKTSSNNLPTINNSVHQAGFGCYFLHLDQALISNNWSLNQAEYSTYFGGNNTDFPIGITLDAGNFYATITSLSDNIPVTNNSVFPPATLGVFTGVILRISSQTISSGGNINPLFGDFVSYWGTDDEFGFREKPLFKNGKLMAIGIGVGNFPVTVGTSFATNQPTVFLAISESTMIQNVVPSAVNGDYIALLTLTNGPVNSKGLKEYNGDFYISGTYSNFANDPIISLTQNIAGGWGGSFPLSGPFLQKVSSSTINSNSAINTTPNDWIQSFGCPNAISGTSIDFDINEFGIHFCFTAEFWGTCYPTPLNSIPVGSAQGRSLYYNLCHDGYVNYGSYLSPQNTVHTAVKSLNSAVYVPSIGSIDSQTFGQIQHPLTDPTSYWGGDTTELAHMKFNAISVLSSPIDTLSPAMQTVCQYATPDLIEGMDLTFSSDSLPVLYSGSLIHQQGLNPNFQYQWQVSNSASGPWVDINGANLIDYQPVVGTNDQYYRRKTVIVSCSATLDISTSSVSSIIVNGFAAPLADAGGIFHSCPSIAVSIGGNPSASGGTGPYSYAWDNGLPGTPNPTFNPLDHSIVTLTVTDANGCIHQDQATVYAHEADAGIDASSCAGQGVQIGVPISGVSAVSYAWTPTSALSCSNCPSPIASPNTSAIYQLTQTVSITGGGTCQTIDQVTVIPVAAPSNPNFAGPDETFCFGGTVDIGTASQSGFDYTWFPTSYITNGNTSITTYDPGNVTFAPNPDPGLYTLQADRLGCSFTDEMLVYTINADAGSDGCGPRPIGTPDDTPNLNEIYTWSILSGPGVITGATNTPITTVSSSNGGTTVYELTVSLNGVSCVDQVIVPDCGCYNFDIGVSSPNGCASLPLSGGPVELTALIQNGSNLNYSWTPATGLSNYNSQMVELLSSAPQTYTLTVTDPTGNSLYCTQTIDVNLPAWSIPNSLLIDTIICINDSIELVENFVTGFSYDWTNLTTSIPNPLVSVPPGDYEFYVTVTDDQSGCMVDDTAFLSVFGAEAFAGADWYVCSNSLIQLGENPLFQNVNYSWSPPIAAWQNGTNEFSAQPQVLINNSVQFILTTSNSLGGCMDTDTVNVFVDNLPILPPLSDTTICLGEAIQIGPPAQNGIIYNWTPAAGLSCTDCAQPFVDVSTTTTYTLTIDQIGNCTNTSSGQVIVTVNDPSFVLNDINFCSSNVPINLNVSGAPSGYTDYQWSPISIVPNPTVQHPFATPQSGVSSLLLTATDATGCSYTDTLQLIPLNTPPDAGSNLTICINDGPVQIGNTANTGLISWSPGIGLSSTTSPVTTFTPSSTGIFNYAISSTINGCTQTDSVQIIVNDFDYPTLTSEIICANSCVQIGGADLLGHQYSWSPALNTPNIANPTVCPLQTTLYTLFVTAPNGCHDTEYVTVTVSDTIAPTISITTVDACMNDTSIFLNPLVTPSALNYAYQWNPGIGLSNTSILNPQLANFGIGSYQYNLTITNQDNGCIGTGTGILNITNCTAVDTCAIPFQISILEDTLCSGGFADLSFVSDSSNVTYTWESNPYNSQYSGSGLVINFPIASSSQTLDSVVLQITPSLASCTGEMQEATIFIYPQQSPLLNGNTSYCAGDSALLFISGPYSNYTWNGTTSQDTSYYGTILDNPITLELADTNNCTYSLDTVLIELPTYYSLDTLEICDGDSVLIHGAFESVSGIYLDSSIVNGCDSISEILLTILPLPNIAVTYNTLEICIGDSITFTASGADNYFWNGTPGPFNFSYSPTMSSQISIIGALNNGCLDSTQFDISIHPIQSPILNGNTSYCAGDSAFLFISGPYSNYTWNGTTSQDSSYYGTILDNPITLELADTNNCTYSLDTLLIELPTYYSLDTLEICAGDSISIHGNFESTAGVYVNSILVNGCDSISEVLLNILPVPTLNVIYDTLEICLGDSMNFFASGADNYFWNGIQGPANFSYSPTLNGQISTVGTLMNGCSDSLGFDFIIHPIGNPGFNFAFNTYCIGGTNPLPVITGDTTGFFYADPGITIDSLTGLVDLASSTAGSYTVTYNSGGLCPEELDTVITIIQGVSPFFSYDSEIYCDSANPPIIVINNSVATNAFTSFPVGLIVDNNSGMIDLNQSIPGTYVVTNTLTYSNCPVVTFDTVITINELPTASLTGSYFICDSSSIPPIEINFTGNGPWFLSYEHLESGTITNDTVTQTPYQIPNTQLGTYNLISIADSNCIGTANGNATIALSTGPITSSMDTLFACHGDLITPLSFSSSSPNSTYQWSTVSGDVGQNVSGIGDIDPFNADNQGSSAPSNALIGVVATDSLSGCIGDTAVLVIQVNPLPEIMVTQGLSGCAPQVFQLENLIGNSLDYCQWVLADTIIFDACNPTFNAITPGCYDLNLTVTNAYGCINTYQETDYICVSPPPISQFFFNPSDPTIVENTVTFHEQATDASSFTWLIDQFETQSGQSATFTFPSSDTATYTICLIAESSQVCKDTFCIDLLVDYSFEVFVPNSFTPNGDSENNTFKPVLSSPIKGYLFEIFNRWGELIFTSNDPNDAWDGTYKGAMVSDGVYTWKLRLNANLNDDVREFFGHVSVLR